MAARPRIAIAGSVAVVTGAGSGIGRATALSLAERGARAVCVDVDLEAVEKTAAACEERGGAPAVARRVDVADRAAVQRLADEVLADHGPVGILVNNAGVGMTGHFADMTEADWTWIRSVNLDGVVNGCAAFAPQLLAAGRGHVVNVSSALGYTITATESAYVTTKAAVLAFSRCLRADWAGGGVAVTAVCPGVINTPIVDHTRFVGEVDTPQVRRRTRRLFRRGHKPEQVAAAIVDAVERNRAVVPVGFEARLGWLLHRFGPLALQQAIARRARRRGGGRTEREASAGERLVVGLLQLGRGRAAEATEVHHAVDGADEVLLTLHELDLSDERPHALDGRDLGRRRAPVGVPVVDVERDHVALH